MAKQDGERPIKDNRTCIVLTIKTSDRGHSCNFKRYPGVQEEKGTDHGDGKRMSR